MSVVTSIFRSGKKLYFLAKHLTGSLTLKPLVDGIDIGNFIYSSNLPKNFWIYYSVGNLIMVRFVNFFTLFSNIFVNGTKKYSTANGTFCRLIEFFYDFNVGKIMLPSRQVKIISGWNFVILGKNAQTDYKFNCFGKAGYNITIGKKSKVRGVARNPVDHPHGGRTKTNKPEVSIWGWVAKNNK